MSTPAKAAAATLLTVTLALAGCSSGEQAPTPGTSAATATAQTAPSGAGATSGSTGHRGEEGDIAFAQSMIPHHEQAVEMSTMAQDERHAASEQVRALARRITETQEPEIAQMTGWLAEWGVEDGETAEPGTASPTPEATGTGEPTGATVMSPEAMESLAAAQGPAFDRQWLEMMIDHHAGAVRSARDVLLTTTNPEVKALADSMVTTQTAEIDELRALLKGVPTG